MSEPQHAISLREYVAAWWRTFFDQETRDDFYGVFLAVLFILLPCMAFAMFLAWLTGLRAERP